MATTYEGKAVLEMETTGSTVEAGAAIAVVVLAIIGLARADTGFMTSIATIVLGTALLLYGATIAAGYSKLLTMVTGGTLGAVELGGGMTVEILAGGSAIVLGILGLIGFSPEILLPCAVMAVGAALILSASGVQRLSTLRVEAAGLSEMAQNISQSAVIGAILRAGAGGWCGHRSWHSRIDHVARPRADAYRAAGAWRVRCCQWYSSDRTDAAVVQPQDGAITRVVCVASAELPRRRNASQQERRKSWGVPSLPPGKHLGFRRLISRRIFHNQNSITAGPRCSCCCRITSADVQHAASHGRAVSGTQPKGRAGRLDLACRSEWQTIEYPENAFRPRQSVSQR